jgi:small conductance mechanosensitive channel
MKRESTHLIENLTRICASDQHYRDKFQEQLPMYFQMFPMAAKQAKPAHPTATAPMSDIPAPSALEHEHFWKVLGREWQGDLLGFLHISLPKLIVIGIITLILVQILVFITRRLRHLGNPSLVGPGRAAQIQTLASVIQTAGWGLIIFHAAIQSLEIFNINVTPLLASAGVAGVAVGFGAQTIVHDVINGMLILVENQFNVGEVVKVASLTGTVEAMSLRKTTLRDGGDGTLYTIPNSQITTVSNLTRDWSQIQVNISVDYREDPDRVISVLTELANGVAQDKRFASVMSGPPQVLGVDAFKGSEVIYPVVFKTTANNQWGVSREFRRLVKIRFQQDRILLGDPQRVYNYPPGGGSQPVAQVAPQVNVQAEAHSATTVSPTDTTPKT